MNQLESVMVTSPPVPALLPVKPSMWSKKVGSFSVTVNDIHFDCSTLPQNTCGRPNAPSFMAIRSHNAHDPVSLIGLSGAGVVMLPVDELSTIEPRVANR